MNEKLSEKDKKFIELVENIVKNRIQNYVVIALLYCMAIAGIIFGFLFKSKDGFLFALFFGFIATYILIGTKVYIKFCAIIRKLRF